MNHAPDRYTKLTEDEFMDTIKDYIAWVDKATADGIYIAGHKLASVPGKTVTASGNAIEVHDAPFAELTEVWGGLMMIEASDLDAAVEIAKLHPHLIHNTTMDIRQIEEAD